MSDTKKTNANKAETKTTDTAPYMKKDRQTDGQVTSSKSNIVIPLILLLVSAIVIAATFYEDEDNNLVADNDSPANTTEESVSAESALTKTITANEPSPTTTMTQTDGANTVTDKNITKVTESVVQNVATAVKGTSSDTNVSAQNKAQTRTSSSFKENKIQQQANNVVAKQSPPADNQARKQTYEQSMAGAQEQAKKRNKMIQRRRQTYEKEMQSRRQQYEAAMKTREEKRAKFFKEQKAVFQRVQQNRIETNQKLQEVHKLISDLHDEIHQIMRESGAVYKRPPATQTKNPSID